LTVVPDYAMMGPLDVFIVLFWDGAGKMVRKMVIRTPCVEGGAVSNPRL